MPVQHLSPHSLPSKLGVRCITILPAEIIEVSDDDSITDEKPSQPFPPLKSSMPVQHPSTSSKTGVCHAPKLPTEIVEVPDDDGIPQTTRKKPVPLDNLPVMDLLQFPLPNIVDSPFGATAVSCFDTALPVHTPNLAGLLPPKAFIGDFRKVLANALVHGKCSIRYHHYMDIPLPLWVIPLWEQLHHVHTAKAKWVRANDWLQTQMEKDGGMRVFHDAYEQLSILPWNRSLHGEAACNLRSTLTLALLLSPNYWLSEAVIDVMTACLVSRLPNERPDVLIVNTSFADAIHSMWNITSYDGLEHKAFHNLKESVKKHRIMYAPMHLQTKDHYVMFWIDFERKSFSYGDSLDYKKAPEYIIERPQWWFEKHFGGKLCNNGPVLLHGVQQDCCSCGLFAINTIEHHVFAHDLGVPNPTSEQARWFVLCSQNQVQHLRVSNMLQGCSFTMAADISNQAITEEPCCTKGLITEHHKKMEQARAENARNMLRPDSILPEARRCNVEHLECEKVEKDKAELKQLEKKVESELAEKKKAELERLQNKKVEKVELERVGRELADKVEKEKVELERVERELARKEKDELKRVEREQTEKEKPQQDRLDWERLERERAEHEQAPHE
ncbi:hypothetical protein DFH29DRAFT_1006122 [Suillus ampliporus]|nr:hypothetical protein DFH29DRAFT_1006122 [Suillus ampliporus]